MADRAPANLLIGSAKTKNLNFVRRYVLEGNIVAGYQSDLNDLGLPIIGHESEVDNELQILKFDRAESGKKDIIMANFQAHPHRDSGAGTTLYTANIVGFFRTELEEKQNVHVLYFTGASGNVNASSQIPEENITPPSPIRAGRWRSMPLIFCLPSPPFPAARSRVPPLPLWARSTTLRTTCTLLPVRPTRFGRKPTASPRSASSLWPTVSTAPITPAPL